MPYYTECREVFGAVAGRIPEIPFSNAWMAQQTIGRLPENSVLHLGILNTLRTWNFFEVPDSVDCYSNTGGCMFHTTGNTRQISQKVYFLELPVPYQNFIHFNID